jgi:hypothetical protein
MSDTVVNKVAESGLITLDPARFLGNEKVVGFDLKDFLFMGAILREKDFREAMQTHDWSVYAGAEVAVFCSADAIIPMWAYMLVSSRLSPVAASCYAGTPAELRKKNFLQNLDALDTEAFRDQRVVVKGCGDEPIGEYAYLEITRRLQPVVKSLMYGEACSAVPVYKKKAD